MGNSLAVCLPASGVELLGVNEGDEIEIAGERALRVGWEASREQALARLKALQWDASPGSKWSRDDPNER